MNGLVKKMQDKILERVANQFNPRKSNKIEDEIHSIFKTLRDNDQLSELESLLTHENNTVVSYACQYLLAGDEKKALRVLKNIAKRKDVNSHTINMTIKEWKNGELNLDY